MFAYGADIGWLSQFEEMGYVWLDENGRQRDVLDILAEFGINALRLRVFVDPPESPVWIKSEDDICFLGYADPKSVLKSAKRAADKNFRIMIDFHYSDYFADPKCQMMPRQWEGHSYEKLLEDVYEHTCSVMDMLAKQNIFPEWVQVGNEINGGMMLPAGEAEHSFSQLAGLLDRGYEAVKEISPGSKVITHLAEGQDRAVNQWFFDRFLSEHNGKTDIIGVSYYPYWIGSDYTETIDVVKDNLSMLSQRYQKDVMICEIGGNEKEEKESYCFVKAVIEAVKSVKDDRGKGVFWWEPEANSAILPDKYPLGATRMIDEKTIQFTNALCAFREAR